jgi:hypothetical protein
MIDHNRINRLYNRINRLSFSKEKLQETQDLKSLMIQTFKLKYVLSFYFLLHITLSTLFVYLVIGGPGV